MPIYPFKCLHVQEFCGRDFELVIPLGIYDQHRTVAFRDVQCPHCWRRGAVRTWNPGDGPYVHMMYGQFGIEAHPKLVGKTFSSREEHNRMLAAVGEDRITVSAAETRSRQHGVAKSSEQKKVEVPDRVGAAALRAAALADHEAIDARLAEVLDGKKARRSALLAVVTQQEFDEAVTRGVLVKHRGGWYSAA